MFRKYMKLGVLAAVVFSASACKTLEPIRSYDEPALVIANSKMTRDEFRGFTKISGPYSYAKDTHHWDSFYLLRYMYLDTGLSLDTVQLYVQLRSDNWVFFESAHLDDGTQAEFKKLDSRTERGYSSAYTIETVSVMLPLELVRQRAKSEEELKVMLYGKRGQQEVRISRAYLAGFVEFLDANI